jgi:hypothetical protein
MSRSMMKDIYFENLSAFLLFFIVVSCVGKGRIIKDTKKDRKEREWRAIEELSWIVF